MFATASIIWPPVPKVCPDLSRKRKPSACSIPNPASLVALPPIPIIKFLHPLFNASFINSPVPKVVVSIGFLCSIGTRGSPLMAAISIIAVLPLPDRP